MTARDFSFWVEDDRIRVKHVSPKTLTPISSGQSPGADYRAGVIRITRGETAYGRQGYLLHELGHYLVERVELGKTLTEEDACDLFAWIPFILRDRRNGDLRAYLGLEK